MDNLNHMKHEELIELQLNVEARLKDFRPVRLKKKWKRCGRAGCFCADGPSDGSWDNLHGPYIFAQFVDRKTKKTRLVSLGNFYSQDDIDEVRNEILDWSKYFAVPEAVRDQMNEKKRNKYVYFINVTGRMFEQFYGISEADDKLDRHTVYYATQSQREAYDTCERRWNERQEAVNNEWAELYGLGSRAGQRKLAQILADDYYIK